MAGVGKNAVLVDVVAAAAQLAGRASVDVFSAAEDGTRQKCGLGHVNDTGARFCSSCGLPMDAPPPPGADPAAEGRPKPAFVLTADEAAERNKQHAEVVAALARAEQQVPDLAAQPDPSERKLLIHFIEDGFTWAGRVWNVGDELEIGPEHPRWSSAVGWISLSKTEQVARYGRVFFDQGPWPYRQHIAPGTEIPLPEAGLRRVQAMRQNTGVPARGTGDVPNSLVPM